MFEDIADRVCETVGPVAQAVYWWLCCHVNWKEGLWAPPFLDEPITVKPGQIIISERDLAETIRVNRDTLRKAFISLENGGFVTRSPTKRYTTVTLINYDEIKSRISDTKQAVPEVLPKGDTIEDVKTLKIKEVRQKTLVQNGLPPNAFEPLWQQYPRREGRRDAERHFNSSVKTMKDFLDIQNAMANYKKKLSVEGVSPQYTKMGSTWFNNWRDYVSYVPIVPEERARGGNAGYLHSEVVEGKYAAFEKKQKERRLSDAGKSNGSENGVGTQTLMGDDTALGKPEGSESGGQR